MKAVDCLERKMLIDQRHSFISKMPYKKRRPTRIAWVVAVGARVKVFVNKVLAG